MSSLRPIEEALKLPGGARYRRCVLLRPFALNESFNGDEASYNTGLVDRLRQLRIDLVAILGGELEALSLRQAVEAAGLDAVVVAERSLQEGLARLPAADVRHPDAVTENAWCWVKASECSPEALRQAVLDPESRIRPAASAADESRSELLALAFQSGGFLGDMAIRFNDNLNVLVGGRGTGKSTILESLRYVLDREALGEEARKSHAGIVRNVLRSGTRISLLVRSHRPTERDYLIERTVPNPPIVRSATGEVLDLTPGDVLGGIEIYGQHEIAELVRNPDKLTRLLERFVRRDDRADERRGELAGDLAASRRRVLDLRRELTQVQDRLASLPALEETLQRFEEAGLEEKLGERSLLVREEQILRSASERLRPLRDVLGRLSAALPLEREQLKPEALAELPGKWILAQAEPALAELEAAAGRARDDLEAALQRAEAALANVDARFAERRSSVQESYEETLRELQESRIDGEEFIRLRQQIERLRPLKERESQLRQELANEGAERRRLLAALEDERADAFRELERAADRVNEQLVGRVRVRLTYAGHREPLFTLLREQVGGRLSETLDTLRRREALSLGELVAACRAGREVLEEKFAIPPSQADRLAQAEPATLMEIEELELDPTTAIELNVGGWSGAEPVWQPLEDLSTGQKATAVLLLLLLESDAPLIVDQPEDDLDNRFIADGIVPTMREEKRRRQFLFATHNANIPVIGDAELILGLTATGEAGKGRASIAREHMGSIDNPAVQELVGEILEGGRNAFEMRRRKYGF